MPRRFAVRAMRTAISPRLAIRTEPNMGAVLAQGGPEKHDEAPGCPQAEVIAWRRDSVKAARTRPIFSLRQQDDGPQTSARCWSAEARGSALPPARANWQLAPASAEARSS